MNDSSFPVPDVWGAINVYYAHIQSIKEFKDRYDGLMSEKEKFDIAKAQLKIDQETLATKQAELIDGQQKLKEDQGQLENERTTLQNAKDQLARDKETLESERAQLTKDQEEFRLEKEAFEATKLHCDPDTKRFLAVFVRFQDEIRDLKVKNGALETKCGELTAKNEELTNALKKSQDENAVLEQERQKLTAENATLVGQIGEKDKQIEGLNTQQTRLSDDNALLTARNNAYVDRLRILEERIKALESENSCLKDKLSSPCLIQPTLVDRGDILLPLASWNTRKKGLGTYENVAAWFKISLDDLQKINPTIPIVGQIKFNWDQDLQVLGNIDPETGHVYGWKQPSG